MIKKLKKRFIILATVSVFILMTVLVGIMNAINYSSVLSQTDAILDVLSRPDAPFTDAQSFPGRPPQDIMEFIPRGMSPEVLYEARFFTAMVSKNGVIEEYDVSRIVSVDRESVVPYVREAIAARRERGFVGQFRYAKQSDDRITRILFLDCGRKLDSFRKFMWISSSVGLLGCVSVFVLFMFAAERIVHPIAESYEKQKRFITDAGHEIKTPLTIIGANLDLLEDDCGENESIRDIRTQTKRLGKLTSDLVYLSKMEEPDVSQKKIPFSVSEVLTETAEQFQAVAQAKNIAYSFRIEPDIAMCGTPEAMRQLASVLLDNAMKYTPDGGTVTLKAAARKRDLSVSVFNTTAEPISQENLSHLFDRFYRTDASRNSETGGHGLGLSIAQAITEAHGGKIKAETQNRSELRITAVFPL